MSILYYFAAFLLPNIFLFYLFNNNKVLNHLLFSHFVVLAAFLSIISITIYMVLKKTRSGFEGAFITMLIFWIFFWLFETIFNTAAWYSAIITRGPVCVGLAVVIAIVFRSCCKYGPVLVKYRSAFLVITVMICVLFVYNFVPALFSEVIFSLINPSSEEKLYNTKTEFVIDDSLPNPDIYWLHMDQMMGFSAVEKYFGDSQDELKTELTKHGFVLNEDAELHAGYTRVAVPALLSPAFFDSYLGLRLDEVKYLYLPHRTRRAELDKRHILDGVDLYEDIAPNLELFTAFMQAGYTAVTIAEWAIGDTSNIRPIDVFYRSNEEYPLIIKSKNTAAEKKNLFFEAFDLTHLLVITTPLSIGKEKIIKWINKKINEIEDQWMPIPEHEFIVSRMTEKTLGIAEEKRLFRRLYDSFSISSPKLVYITNFIAHNPYDKIYATGKLENPSPKNSFAVDLLYMPQYKYTVDVMLNMLDMILEENPNAIIVIQGDHGIHSDGQIYMINKGYPASQIFDMNYSVISAVRIPQQYGGSEEPIDPLNISRLLVNRFVGKNYELLTKGSTD